MGRLAGGMRGIQGVLSRRVPPPAAFLLPAALAAAGIGAVLVVRDGAIVGIVSERDYARKVILLGRSSQDVPVREIMGSPLLTVGPGHSVEDCMSLMTSRRVRHLPVMDSGRLVGLLSIGDTKRTG